MKFVTGVVVGLTVGTVAGHALRPRLQRLVDRVTSEAGRAVRKAHRTVKRAATE